MKLSHLQNGSDIRGIALDLNPNESVNFSDEQADILARAFCVWLRKMLKKQDLTIAVGRDSRLSGPTLAHAIIDGLVFEGADVFDCAMATTPAMFMSTVFEDINADGAIMITASHLPANRNGMKFFWKGGGLDAEQIAEIIAIGEKGDFKHGFGGSVTRIDLMKEYSEHLRRIIQEKVNADNYEKPLEGMHIIVDAGNGAGGFYVDSVLEPLGANTEGSQFLEPDGTFPNHIPNPEDEEALASISKAVIDHKADLGLIFDTDVDRSAAVDGDGRTIARNDLIALAAIIAKKAHPDLTVVTDSVTSDELSDFLEKNHIHHHRFKRGYKNVINEAKRLNDEGEDAALAIETSGHAAFKDNYFLDDGAYLASQILVEAASSSIADLLSSLDHPEEEASLRIPVNADSFREYGKQVIEDLKNYARESDSITLVEPNHEGARIRFNTPEGKGWLLLRLSLHENILPVNIESKAKGGTKAIARELFEFLSQYPSLDLSALKKAMQ